MNGSRRRFANLIVYSLLLADLAAIASWRCAWCSEEKESRIKGKYGMALSYGHSYRPMDEVAFAMVTVFGMYSVSDLLQTSALEPLHLKVEASVGSAYMPDVRFMGLLNLAAVYYLDSLFPGGKRRFRPYLDFGAGGIYTDFQVEGQGLRINFNPIASLGVEIIPDRGPPYFVAVRWHHISNAETKSENRGVNSLMFMIGRYF